MGLAADERNLICIIVSKLRRGQAPSGSMGRSPTFSSPRDCPACSFTCRSFFSVWWRRASPRSWRRPSAITSGRKSPRPPSASSRSSSGWGRCGPTPRTSSDRIDLHGPSGGFAGTSPHETPSRDFSTPVYSNQGQRDPQIPRARPARRRRASGRIARPPAPLLRTVVRKRVWHELGK